MSKRANFCIGITAAIGAVVLAHALWHWQSDSLPRFFCYLLIAVLASGLKIKLPGIDGTMSVNFVFILLGVLEMSLPETLLIGCAAALAQCTIWLNQNRPDPIKVVFNVLSMMTNAIALSYLVFHSLSIVGRESTPLLLVIAALVYFLANTLPVAVMISLTEGGAPRKVWAECYFWSFPYYLVGAALVFLVDIVNRHTGWQTGLLVLPVVYWVYRSYRLYLERLEAEKKQAETEKRHAQDIAQLHLRTIEALALAIEAKDQTTHSHLQRVRIYALEVGKELGFNDEEIEALRAAALLHDIGKLAVPEQIISKPGRLTPEEFEKMKIHPIVGSDILERVAFPYPVAPVVRSHHERWDGSGYPDGLKSEEIPRGARVLAAVDCLDALASHRQYRPALPLDVAMKEVEKMSGSSFDPAVVEILSRRYRELEALTRATQNADEPALAVQASVEREVRPAAGFEQMAPASPAGDTDFLVSIASARQEAQNMFELSQDLGTSLSLSETLSVLSIRLRKLVPYESMVVFLLKEDHLVPELVSGDNFRLLSSLQIKMGEGLCGWVAENRKPIVNGNPQVEAGYLADAGKYITQRSALAVPLEGLNGVVGVLSVYRTERDAFSADHLRVLLAISSKIALSIENALKYQQAESSSVTDYLTGLPNARSLYMHLSGELSRCRRTGSSLAVMVCDLDNFKQINDLHGHLEGDNLLRDFASRLKETCRGYDYVARMGGDEFVVVAPGMQPEAGIEKARLIKELAVDAGRKITGGEELVSLSHGIAFCPQDGFDIEQLLAEADRRMYSVKQLHHAEGRSDVPNPHAEGAAAT